MNPAASIRGGYVAVAAPTGHRPGRPLAAALVDAVARAGRAAGPLSRRAAGGALTIAGLAVIDAGCFLASAVAGLIVTGLSLLVLDWHFTGGV